MEQSCPIPESDLLCEEKVAMNRIIVIALRCRASLCPSVESAALRTTIFSSELEINGKFNSPPLSRC
jgi:hypothetical protein